MAEDERETGGGDAKDETGGGDAKVKSESGEPTAPSIGTKTEIEHVPPEERLAGHEHATEDAMGRDKRRAVKGETYGPTKTRVILSFVVFFAVVGVIFIGLLFLVGRMDQPPDTVEAKAPWSAEDASQHQPVPVDSRPDGAEGELGAQQVSSGTAGNDD